MFSQFPQKLNYAEFTQWALYHPNEGYYQKVHSRIGRSKVNDFYTATCLNPVFGRLLLAALQTLMDSKDKDIAYHLVELGVEPHQPSFQTSPDAFLDYQTIGLADPLKLPSNAVVFANELLDAQPFQPVAIFKRALA